MSDSSALVNKLWAFCDVLRNDGVLAELGNSVADLIESMNMELAS